MSERNLKERVERLETFLVEKLNYDLEAHEAADEAALEAFAERDPDHAERTEASDADKEHGKQVVKDLKKEEAAA